MEISKLGFYPKFVFMSEDGDFCVSHADVEIFQQIKNCRSKKEITSLKIGDEIFFEYDDTEKISRFIITDVSITRITNNTDSFKYGYDLEDCTNMVGTPKEFLFKVMVKMKPIK